MKKIILLVFSVLLSLRYRPELTVDALTRTDVIWIGRLEPGTAIESKPALRKWIIMLGRSLCLTALILASEVAWAISDDDYITGARGEGYGSSGGLLGLWWILAILIWVLYEKWKKHKNSKEPTWEDKMVEYRKLAAQREAEEKEFYGDHKKGEK